MRGIRVVAAPLWFAAITATLVAFPSGDARAAGPRIDLKVLVVSDGSAPVSAIVEQLKTESVPYQLVDLGDGGRPVIDHDFLEDTVSGVARAKYQAVVLPNENPFGNAAEMTALADYERKFGVRQVDAYVYPKPDVGLNWPTFAGPLDGTTASVSNAGLAGPLRYLRGPVRFDDNSPSVPESYGYLAAPLPDDPSQAAKFEPLVTATQGGTTGPLAGVYTKGTRSELVLTYAYNAGQWQFRTIGHGIISWMTKGVHLGHSRSYFSVHVDDVFLPDSRWDTGHNCTPGEGCPPEVTTPDIRMTAADVSKAVSWQTQSGLKLDMVYNAGGSAEAIEQTGSDALTTALLANKAKFRWVNHTYEHPYLGCEQDVSVIPWRCKTDGSGNVVYVAKDTIKEQITKNADWGRTNGLDMQANELVTGEHSGLKILPQQPDDNPSLAPALAETGIGWTASDASREPAQRAVGNALTVPRYPMSVYFNVGTKDEMVDEYNWIYTSRADGGSGLCEDHPDTMTCIQPLSTATGYDSYIIPVDSRITLSHIVANDPRPHYVHQSNLAESRILYPMLDRILGDYKAAFASNAPLVTVTMSALGTQLKQQTTWRAAMDNVTAYVQDGKLKIQAPADLNIPVTAPEGTLVNNGTCGGALNPCPAFGNPYAGERSAYRLGSGTLILPAGAMG